MSNNSQSSSETDTTTETPDERRDNIGNGENDVKNDSFSLLETAQDVSSEFEDASESPMAVLPPSKNTRNRVRGGNFGASFVPHSPGGNMYSSYVFSAGEFAGLTQDLDKDIADADAMDAAGAAGATGKHPVFLLPNNHLPFVGREAELDLLHKAVDRISLEWMENPSEVVWISGARGVGKTALVQHASEMSSAGNAFAKCFLCRGTCEQYHTAAQPFQALTDCLNDLCWQLIKTSTASKAIWKQRLEEALGGEGPLVGTICPALCQTILDCAPMDRRTLLVFDANTAQRLDRLAFAVRDMLLAVASHHPIVMIVDQIQYADPDSLTLFKDLLTSKPLLNFLLIGIYDSSLVVNNANNLHPLTSMKELLSANPNLKSATRTTEIRLQAFSSDQVAQIMEHVLPHADDMDLHDLVDLVTALTKGNPLWIVQLLRLWNDQKLITAIEDKNKTTLWTWNRKKIKKEVKRWREEGLECAKSCPGVIQARLELLPRKVQFVVMVLGKLKLTMIRLHDEQSQLPAVTPKDSLSKQQPPPKSQFYRVFVAAAFQKSKKGEKDPISSQDELEKMVLKACAWGVLKKLRRPGCYKFANDWMRECAATLVSPYESSNGKRKSGRSSTINREEAATVGGNPLKFQLYMGTELSAMSMEATKAVEAATANALRPPMSPNPQAPPPAAATKPPLSPAPPTAGPARPPSAAVVAATQQRERYKFLAVEQLYTVHGAMNDAEKGKLAKINLEAAEIAISKTAFQTAIIYLERGIAAVDLNLRWQQQPNFYDVTLRSFLFLARMRLCCGLHSAAKAACEEIFENCTNTKDRIWATQVLVLLLQKEEKYGKAMEVVLEGLKRLGEIFPPVPNEEAKHIIEREINSLRKGVAKMTNQELLNPKKLVDKKSADIMLLLAHMVEICRNNPHPTATTSQYAELAMIRMVHHSIKMGFTRQYPIAFSLFGVALVDRGLLKDAHRMGQIAEKIARLSDYYGAEAVAIFHCHISHWHRTFKRNLQPILRIYNAQVDAGDFCHVGFSISTYIQYHLASGFDIDKLSDNLQLFRSLYVDYKLKDDWLIQISQQAVSNMLGETSTPLIFFGVTMAQQDAKVEEFQKERMPQAVQYLYLLRMFVAFFFHNLEVMKECLENLVSPIKGVWITWVVFMECFMLIQDLPLSKGKQRKELKEKIDHLRNKLIDWYNDGAPNPSAMISILEAEWKIAKEAGKGLSAMKAQELFNEAAEAAASIGNPHLEAFACERAALHFVDTGVGGLSAEFMVRSHKAYDRCNYISKVIDLETNHNNLLNIKHKRARPASAYNQINASLRRSEQEIGGGHQDIRTVNVKKGIQNAAKALRHNGVKSTSRKVKELFKREKAAPAPWGWGSKGQLALDDDGTANEEDGPIMSPSPRTKSSRIFRVGTSKNKDEEGNQDSDVAGKNEDDLILSPSPKPRSSRLFGGGKKKNKDELNDEKGNEDTSPQSPMASRPSTTTSTPSKSPRRSMASLFRKAAPPPLSEENDEGNGGGGEDINDMLESPKPRGSRRLPVPKDGPAINLPMGDDFDSEEEAVTSKRASKAKSKK